MCAYIRGVVYETKTYFFVLLFDVPLGSNHVVSVRGEGHPGAADPPLVSRLLGPGVMHVAP